jgi:hypothetical protein
MQLTSRQAQMLNKAVALLPAADQAAFTKSVHNVIDRWGFTTSDAEIRDLLRVLLSKHGISVSALLFPQGRRFVHDRRGQNWRDWERKHHEVTSS